MTAGRLAGSGIGVGLELDLHLLLLAILALFCTLSWPRLSSNKFASIWSEKRSRLWAVQISGPGLVRCRHIMWLANGHFRANSHLVKFIFLPGQKVLTCSVRIFELCEQIDSYINNMEPYALRFAFRSMFRLFINILIWWINRFASFWLLILEHFTKCISDKYFQVHLPAK
jgi:hypothetical protein